MPLLAEEILWGPCLVPDCDLVFTNRCVLTSSRRRTWRSRRTTKSWRGLGEKGQRLSYSATSPRSSRRGRSTALAPRSGCSLWTMLCEWLPAMACGSALGSRTHMGVSMPEVPQAKISQRQERQLAATRRRPPMSDFWECSDRPFGRPPLDRASLLFPWDRAALVGICVQPFWQPASAKAPLRSQGA